MEPKEGYRQLHIPIRRPSRLMSRFAWLTGISIVVLFLACVVMAYKAYHAK